MQLSVSAMQWQNTYWVLPYLIYVLTNFGAHLPQSLHNPRNIYVHQNERLSHGQEWGAITFIADTRYHGDVILEKRHPKIPFTFNGGEVTET